MPSVFTTSLRFEDQANGENSSTWGDKTDNNFLLVEQAITGILAKSVAGGGNVSLTAVNGVADESRNAVYQLTGALTGNISVIVPAVAKAFTVYNNTSGAFTLTVRTALGTGVTVPQGKKMALYCDAVNVVDGVTAVSALDVIAVLTARGAIDESKGANIASAATTNIWATDGNYVHVTGTTPITSFGTAPRAGASRKVTFDGILTLTNGADLILPTAANITTAAGDVIEVVAETTTTHRVVKYERADGSALTLPATITGAKTFTGLVTLQAALNEAAFADVASAATTNIGAAASSHVRITGNINITAFDTVTAGISRKVRFASTGGVLTSNAAIIVPGGASITWAANDTFTAVSLGAGNWIVTEYQKASGQAVAVTAPGYAAKTANYTVLGTDRDAFIRWTTAGATATLTAAATLGSGFRVTLMNAAASGDVTINPNASETLDGLATRLLRPGDQVEIVCDGSNWFTVAGTYSFYSTAQTINNATLLTLAHGLGVAPNIETDVSAYIKATATDAGYAIDDEVSVPIRSDDFGSAGGYGMSVIADATNVLARQGAAADVFVVAHKTTGANTIIDGADWGLFIVARLRYPGRR